MNDDYTMIFRGYKVEHYANAKSALVYTDYCYTPKAYVELCRKYDGLIRNANSIRNAKIPNNSEFHKIVEIRNTKCNAQKKIDRERLINN